MYIDAIHATRYIKYKSLFGNSIVEMRILLFDNSLFDNSIEDMER